MLDLIWMYLIAYLMTVAQNLYSTLQSCKTTLKFKPNINTVIFHRDSDFYDDEEDKVRLKKD